MAKAIWLVVVALVCVAQALTKEDFSDFLIAFPNANVTALLELPPSFFAQSGEVDEPLPLVMACSAIPVPPDTNNIYNLRPGNIRVVTSLGDSVTAGMSAKDTSILSLKEYRGLSYSIGGDTGLSTLPNILKAYVPSGYPIGFSTGIGQRTSAGNGLNAAVSGAINSDMLGQAQWLTQQLKANSKINFANDWKLLTIWIGSNNLCDVCQNQNNNNGPNFETNVIAALEYLYQNVPRLLVNFVANLEISTMYNINSGACSLLHSIACGCVGSSNANNRALVASTGKDYQQRAFKIAQQFNSRNSTQFAVVVQPFLINTIISERSELSAADCFHPSAISHGYAAISLWNNMLVPAAQKKTVWSPGGQVTCPTADTLIYIN